MKFLKYLFFLIFLKCQIIFSQENLKKDFRNILEKNYSNEEKIQNFNKLFIKYKNYSNSVETGLLYSELATLYFKTDKKKWVVPALLKSIAILKKYKKSNLYDLNKSRNNLSWIYMLEGQLNNQYIVLNEIIKDKAKDDITFDALITVAKIDGKRGDYYLSLKKLNLLLSEKQTLGNELIIRHTIVKIYAMMAEVDSKDKFESHQSIILNHQNFIESNFDKSDLDKKIQFEFYNNLANIYESLGNYDAALKLYLKSKKFFEEQKNENEYFFVLNNIGYLYAKQQKINLASQCFKEIINHSNDINQIATAYDNLGYFSNIKPVEKISYFQKAIQTILEKEERNFMLPSLEFIIESGYQQDVLVYLVDLAYNYVESFKNTKNKIYLIKAKETLYLIDELVSLIRYESITEQSKLFWIEKGVNTYMLATEVCYLLDKPEEGFYFMEKNKALLLQENIKTFQAKLEMNIPKKIQEEEYRLHYELISIEKKYQQNPNNKILKQNFNIKSTAFQKFMASLGLKYPSYAKIKQKIEIISLSNALTFIKKEECFISYILNKNDGYGMFCNSNEKIFFKINDIATFQKDLTILKSLISKQLLDKKNIVILQSLSNKVFTALFPFENAVGKLKNKRIYVIADENLSSFPFEALTIEPKDNLSRSYLINQTEISYLQSFSVFKKITEKKNSAKKKLLAIAPYQFEDKNLTELTRSKDVINNLKKYSSCDILIEKDATKENFYSKSSDYEILHLNTHGGIDKLTESPWISFRKDKLTLNELYGINNQAELVILDACKTNDGVFESGEGIISLSRAFFMNGSKSVLASLWNVNEKSGNEIITSFYSELEKGRSKSRALQLAKINYLKQHQYAEVLPYYWASFTLTGSRTPIVLNEKWYYKKEYAILISLVILFTLGLGIMMKIFKRQ